MGSDHRRALETSRRNVADIAMGRAPKELLSTLMRSWIRYFGPMQTMVLDQDGGLVSELASRTCDGMNIKRRYAGTDDNTMTGLVERWVQLARVCAMKIKRASALQGFEVHDLDIAQEAATVSNSMVSYRGQTASQVVLGFAPNDYCDLEAATLDSARGAVASCPDRFGAAVRMRLLAKSEMARATIEHRIARANRTRVQRHGPDKGRKAGDSVDSTYTEFLNRRTSRAGVDRQSWSRSRTAQRLRFGIAFRTSSLLNI